jgi:hypothetical protein
VQIARECLEGSSLHSGGTASWKRDPMSMAVARGLMIGSPST